MKYKEYRGRTKKEALLKAKMENGNSFYVIKEEEKNIGGVLGIFGKKEWVITVGIFENLYKNKDRIIKNEEYEAFTEGINKSGVIENNALDKMETETKEKLLSENNPNTLNTNTFTNDEIEMNRKYQNPYNYEEKSEYNSEKNTFYLMGGIKKFLRYGDFDDNFIEKFIEEISKNKLFQDIDTVESLINKNLLADFKEVLSKFLSKNINIYRGISAEAGRKKVIAFIGPTGAGKTTTLAKLAAYYKLNRELKVKLVCIDYYRLAAKEQLQIYAEILDVKLEWYNNLEDFRKNIDFGEFDLILIDTAGRSQKDYSEIIELRKFLNVIYWDMVKCLVVSSTTKYYDLKQVFRSFEEEIGFDHVILTKLDETNSLGQALSVLMETGKPLTYITNGQDVTKFYSEADINSIMRINFDMMLERFQEMN